MPGELSRQSYSGPWLVRLAGGAPAARAIDPMVARNHDELGQILSGFMAAIALLASDEALTITIAPGPLDG